MVPYTMDGCALLAYLRGENGATVVADLIADTNNRCQVHAVLDDAFWQMVGDLKVNPGKLSLADCFALALAIRDKATLVTSDHHEFDAIVPLGLCPILFIR